MKKLLIFFIILAGFFAVSAQAAEKIDSFDVVININEDATINVTEEIVYDFGSEQRHGIYRDIPVKYNARGGNYSLHMSNVSVTDPEGESYFYDLSKQGRNMRIKIGDPDKYVKDKKTYVISYTIGRAINYFSEHDELYWNVTGNEWLVGIGQATAQVVLPEGVFGSDLLMSCFAGAYGSLDECSRQGTTSSNDGRIRNIWFNSINLNSQEGLTIVVGFPKDIVYEPTAIEKLTATVRDNAILGLPIMVVIFFFYLWRTRGKDPEGRGTVIAQYDPPDSLTPAEVGTIIDEHVNNYDISADIIDLAIRGYIRIHRTEDRKIFSKSVDYMLEKTHDSRSINKDYQRKLFDSLFKEAEDLEHNGRKFRGVKLSNLKNEFYKDFKEIQKNIYESVVLRGYFLKSPNKIRAVYMAIGVIILLLGIILLFTALLAGFSIALSGIIAIVFSWFMPQKTKKGALIKEYILGLKEYITVAEKERIKFHNAPHKSPQLFEKLLPYAMVFRAEKEWAKQFASIYTAQPTWYLDHQAGQFNAVVFASNLHSFTSTANSALSSQARSAAAGGSGFGGGGFSGGGFGGGGGGSW